MTTFYKDIETPSGIVTTYHKITSVGFEFSDRHVFQIGVDSWVSKEAYLQKKFSFDRDVVFSDKLPPDDLPSSHLWDWAFALIKNPTDDIKGYNLHKFVNYIPD